MNFIKWLGFHMLDTQATHVNLQRRGMWSPLGDCLLHKYICTKLYTHTQECPSMYPGVVEGTLRGHRSQVGTESHVTFALEPSSIIFCVL